jgi:6-phosphogluconolactonase
MKTTKRDVYGSIASSVGGALVAVGLMFGASGCGGGSSTQNSPPPAPKQYVYAANYNSNNVSAYSVNTGTGALTPVPGSPFNTAGGQPNQGQTGSVAVDPLGKFVYVSSTRPSPEITAYTINASTGALTAISGSPFAAGDGPGQLAVDPSGKFLYEANEYGPGGVFAFTINVTTGALTQVAGSPFSAPYASGAMIGLAVHPSGKFLYVTDFSADVILGFVIDPATGALTPISGSPFGAGLACQFQSVAVDPSGKFAYATDSLCTGLFGFAIDQTSGTLSLNSHNPVGDFSVAVDRSGKYVYVTMHGGTEGIFAYTLDVTSGALTPVSNGLFAAGSFPRWVTVDPTGKFVYVANLYSGDISAFTLDATSGALTQVSSSPYTAGTYPASVVVTTKIQ